MRTRLLALAALLLGAALLTGSLAGPAAATTIGGDQSGYLATGSTYTGVATSWTVPLATCRSGNDLIALWIGLDGYGDASIEQSGLSIDCSSGRAVYQGWYEVYPAAPVYYSNPISPGDVIKASITRSGNTFTLVLSDATKAWTKTTTKSYNAAGTSAEIIAECPSGTCPGLGVITFTGSTVNGKPLANANPQRLAGVPGVPTAITGGGNFSIQPGTVCGPVCPGEPAPLR